MNLSNYYLDLRRLSYLSESESARIHDYYRDMLYHLQDGKTGISQSMFNTLWYGRYLKEIRNEKIDKVLDENNSINN